jgi:hypothetical protein
MLTEEVLQQRATALLSKIAELGGLIAGAFIGTMGCATVQTPRSPDNFEPWPEEVNSIKTETGRVNQPTELRRSEQATGARMITEARI